MRGGAFLVCSLTAFNVELHSISLSIGFGGAIYTIIVFRWHRHQLRRCKAELSKVVKQRSEPTVSWINSMMLGLTRLAANPRINPPTVLSLPYE
jgi:hypothetical protein